MFGCPLEPTVKNFSPHLLLLPGLVCDAEVWEQQTLSLSGITAVSVADYGTSDSLEKMAQAALQSAPQRFAVAGHSMGGRVALEIFRRAPERVSAIAIMDTGYERWLPGEAGEREKAKRSMFVELANSRGMRAMARQWVQGMVHPDRLMDGLLIASIIDMMSRKTPEIFAAQNNALLERPDAAALLAAIRCPALVLCGREDAWSPVGRHLEMAALILHSKCVAIENCGHMSTMERPDEVTAAMVDWLQGSKIDSAGSASAPAVDAKP
jgi:pimeloyl-ACP methyl ester carboxylesterase